MLILQQIRQNVETCLHWLEKFKLRVKALNMWNSKVTIYLRQDLQIASQILNFVENMLFENGTAIELSKDVESLTCNRDCTSSWKLRYCRQHVADARYMRETGPWRHMSRVAILIFNLHKLIWIAGGLLIF